MDLNELKDRIASIAEKLETEDRDLFGLRLKSLSSVFPFNEYEYALMFLLDRQAIDFQQYETLRDDYVSTNKYLDLYELAPRTFGQTWAHAHIIDLDPRFKRPSRSFDPDYEGQYHLWIEGAKIEVKAARATDAEKSESLVSKGLKYGSDRSFWMNFQQIKLNTCDAFVFIGVWVDQIIYWLLSNEQVRSSQFLSHQHRGGVEYQIGITDANLRAFDQYRVEPSEIGQRVIDSMKNNQGSEVR